MLGLRGRIRDRLESAIDDEGGTEVNPRKREDMTKFSGPYSGTVDWQTSIRLRDQPHNTNCRNRETVARRRRDIALAARMICFRRKAMEIERWRRLAAVRCSERPF